MNESTSQDIRKNVLARIQGTRMRPRLFFTMRLAATIAVAGIALVISALVMSFIFFSIHESGEQFLLGFGVQGIRTFAGLFPWALLSIDIAVIFLLEWLMQGLRLGYRFSLISVFVALAVVSGLLATLVNLTPLHSTLLGRADRGELPIIGEMYEGIRDHHEDRGVYRGTVTSQSNGEFVISHDDRDDDSDDGTRTIMPPPGSPPIRVGDEVYIFGSEDEHGVHATGVRVLDAEH